MQTPCGREEFVTFSTLEGSCISNRRPMRRSSGVTPLSSLKCYASISAQNHPCEWFLIADVMAGHCDNRRAQDGLRRGWSVAQRKVRGAVVQCPRQVLIRT